jgi:hypothetical protein
MVVEDGTLLALELVEVVLEVLQIMSQQALLPQMVEQEFRRQSQEHQ